MTHQHITLSDLNCPELLNAVLGWWWADRVAGLVMISIIGKEGVDGIRGRACWSVNRYKRVLGSPYGPCQIFPIEGRGAYAEMFGWDFVRRSRRAGSCGHLHESFKTAFFGTRRGRLRHAGLPANGLAISTPSSEHSHRREGPICRRRAQRTYNR